jgi:hypothetical protein
LTVCGFVPGVDRAVRLPSVCVSASNYYYREGMMLARVLLIVTVAALAPASVAAAQEPPPQPPPNPTLPWAAPLETSCARGEIRCVDRVVAAQRALTLRLGCQHRAVFAATYWRLTTFMRDAIAEPRFFERPRRIAHEDVEFNEEYQRQTRAWERGDLANVTPDYRAVFAANDAGVLTAQADQLATIAAHVLGDMPSKALEQPRAIMRRRLDAFPFGKPDHDKVNAVLQKATRPITEFIAAHYDPRVDDDSEFAQQLTLLLFEWRERAWRNAEELRFIRAVSGTGLMYRAKLHEIRAESLAAVQAIIASGHDTPAGRAMRDAYCAANRPR